MPARYQHQGSIEMARKSEGSAFERMLELMIAMKQDDKAREGRREREVRSGKGQIHTRKTSIDWKKYKGTIVKKERGSKDQCRVALREMLHASTVASKATF